jgi:hypothetical protein
MCLVERCLHSAEVPLDLWPDGKMEQKIEIAVELKLEG